MRLRTRLTLAFASLAILPAILVAWATLSTVNSSFESMLEARLDGVEALLRTDIDRVVSELDRAVSALASSTPSIDRLAREARLGVAEPASALTLGESLLAGRHDLHALLLIDQEGRVLSSGHLPARSGDMETKIGAMARERPGIPSLEWIEVQRDFGIERALSILVSRPVTDAPADRAPLHVVGGRMVDEHFTERLRTLTGAQVRLLLDGDDAGEEAGSRAQERVRRLPITRDGDPNVQVEFAVSEAGLAMAQRHILAALGGSAILVVLAASLLGALLASRITRPVDALSLGASRISRGDYQPVLAPRATGEIAALIEAFNSMVVEIRASHERVAAAERIAAWQDIARRLAHEIKNPLTPISMSIETLRRTWKRKHPEFEEIFEESTGAILEEVEALERIVTEFSRFARLPAPKLEKIDPAEAIDGALALFKEPPEGVRIVRDMGEGLPPIMADRDQLGQVLLNMLTNALQAMDDNRADRQGEIVVRARGETDTKMIRIDIEDNGPGIEKDHLSELFTPYFTTKETGTGLGLAICHRIVAEHGGRIAVDSQPGKGAKFSVLLPSE